MCLFADEDECQRLPSPCIGNAQCLNMPGSFTCDCPDGYRIRPDGRRCEGYQLGWLQNIHNLSSLTFDFVYHLFSSLGLRNAVWNTLYLASGNGKSIWHYCGVGTDVNECSERSDICLHGECRNLQGSFSCICRPGYHLSPDRTMCIGELIIPWPSACTFVKSLQSFHKANIWNTYYVMNFLISTGQILKTNLNEYSR